MVTNGFMMDSICTLKMVNCNHLTEKYLLIQKLYKIQPPF